MEGILNITNAQCSAIGEALVPATTFPPASSTGGFFSGPLEAATVSLVFPTGNIPGSVPKFFNLPNCAVSNHLSILRKVVVTHSNTIAILRDKRNDAKWR